MSSINKTQVASFARNLQIFLNDLLSHIISDDKRKSYLTPQAMKIWVDAFTHQAASPGSNYERLEFLGDAVLKGVFPLYLTKRYPNLSESEYTNINKVYMSKPKQYEIGKDLGFGKHIAKLSDLSEANYNLVADVFESFFGALSQVSDQVIGVDASGFINCYNMIVYLYKDIKLNDEEALLIDPLTRVNQIFSRFNLGDKEDKKVIFEEMSSNPYTYEVRLTPNQVQFIADKTQKMLESPYTVGIGTGKTQKDAKTNAAKSALMYLKENFGIDVKWAENTKREMEFRDTSGNLRECYTSSLNKAKSDGFVSIKYETPQKLAGPGYSYILLYGVRRDNTSELLRYIKAPESRNLHDSYKTDLLCEYFKHGKQQMQFTLHTK